MHFMYPSSMLLFYRISALFAIKTSLWQFHSNDLTLYIVEPKLNIIRHDITIGILRNTLL